MVSVAGGAAVSGLNFQLYGKTWFGFAIEKGNSSNQASDIAWRTESQRLMADVLLSATFVINSHSVIVIAQGNKSSIL